MMRRCGRLRLLVVALTAIGLLLVAQSWLWRLHRYVGNNQMQLIACVDSGELRVVRGLGADLEHAARVLDQSAQSFDGALAPAEREPAEISARSAEWPEFEWSPRVFRLALPAWITSGFFGLLLVAAIFVPGRRPRWNRCRCGYDLTGDQSGRCPECGRTIVKVSLDPPSPATT